MLILLRRFSASSECTVHGRTLMTADFRNILRHFHKITGNRRQVDENWLLSFFQVFVENVKDFKEWVRDEYRQYTCVQIIGFMENGLSDDISRQAKKNLYILHFLQPLSVSLVMHRGL
jgi:hypothetical protein